MPFVEANGASLFYTDGGEGSTPLLFVHGFACDSHDWNWQLPFFAPGHRVIAVDLRGHGRSSVTDGDYGPHGHVSDLAAFLRALNVPPVIAIGHSLGGLIVTALAVESPELVRAIVVADPSHGMDPELHSGLLDVREALSISGAAAGVVGQLFEGMNGADTAPPVATWRQRRLLGMDERVIVDTFIGLIEATDLLRPRADEYLKELRCPTLALHLNPDWAAWEQSTFVHPGSRAVAWAGTGHWFHQEQSDAFNSTLADWFSTLGQA